MKRIISSVALMLLVLCAFSCKKENTSAQDDGRYINTPRPTQDTVRVKITVPAHVSVSSNTSYSEAFTSRIGSASAISENTRFFYVDYNAIKSMSDKEFRVFTKDICSGALVLFARPTSIQVKEITTKINATMMDILEKDSLSDAQLKNVNSMFFTTEHLAQSVTEDIHLRGVAFGNGVLYSFPDEAKMIYFSSEEETEMEYQPDMNLYDYGMYAETFINFANEYFNRPGSNAGDINEGGIIVQDGNWVEDQWQWTIVYDLRNVSYERESEQIVPACNAVVKTRVFSAFMPAQGCLNKGKDKHVIKQIISIPFQKFNTQPGNSTWWQVGRRHFGPFLGDFTISSTVREKNKQNIKLLIDESMPTNAYRVYTYNENQTLGINNSFGIIIGESPSASTNMGFSYSVGRGVSYSFPVVACTNQTGSQEAKFNYNYRENYFNEGNLPSSHRDPGDGHVWHGSIDQSVAIQHEFQQSYVCTIDSDESFADKTIQHVMNASLKMWDLCWEWKNVFHLKTEPHYNQLEISFTQTMNLPQLNHAVQQWNNLIVTDDKDPERATRILNKLSSTVQEVFEKTFNFATPKTNDTSVIERHCLTAIQHIKNVAASGAYAGLGKFTIVWQRADSSEPYKSVTFEF